MQIAFSLKWSALALSLFLMTTGLHQDVYAANKKPKVTHKENTDGEYANFTQWQAVSDFIDKMVAQHGFVRADLESTFKKIHYVDSAVQYIKPAPPGQAKNWAVYRSRFVEPIRIKAGIDFWNTYESALNRAQAQYGVPAEIIVGILGVETIYGRTPGNFRVLDAITTLAFAYPDTVTREARMSYFRQELENTLLLARETGVDAFSLRGSYAGAIGWPQFMPSSIREYGVDFDGDGKIDLRNSPVDAIGSVANYLVKHGWQKGEPTVFPVHVSPPNSDNPPTDWQRYINQGLQAQYTLEDLKASGVSTNLTLPQDLRYGLVDLQNGNDATEYWLGCNNFFAITQYNRSYFYAMAVIDLAKAVRVARNHPDAEQTDTH